MFEFLDHTADTAVRLTAPDEAGLLREAASALLAIQLGEGSANRVRSALDAPLELTAEDGEALLIDFLNELIYRFDTERLLVAEVEVDSASFAHPAHVSCRLRGETLDPTRHVARTEVKAATFHGLEVRKNEQGWSADVVFDL